MEQVHSKQDMRKIQNRIQGLKFLRRCLLAWRFFPILIAGSYFIFPYAEFIVLLLFVLSILFNSFLSQKILLLTYSIELNEMTLIILRIENGASFSTKDKEYDLYQKTMYTITGKLEKESA